MLRIGLFIVIASTLTYLITGYLPHAAHRILSLFVPTSLILSALIGFNTITTVLLLCVIIAMYHLVTLLSKKPSV